MTRYSRWAGVVAMAAGIMLGAGGTASAVTITFEDVAGVAPVDGQEISNQYEYAYGVSFKLLKPDLTIDPLHLYPVLAKVGLARTAFSGPGPLGCVSPTFLDCDQAVTGADATNPIVNQGVGNWFLTDDGIVPHTPYVLVINYLRPSVTQASGQLLDIDGPGVGEVWNVKAYAGLDGTGGQLGATQVLNNVSTNAGDGNVTPWAFNTPGIQSIIISYATPEDGLFVGFAFDNFSPPDLSSYFGCDPNCLPPQLDTFQGGDLPEPATVTTLLTGIGFIGYRRYRQKRAKA